MTESHSPRQRRFAQQYGPWAVVTGASDGLGRAMAEQLAAGGVHVILNARREARLQALAAELTERHGVEALVVAADLSSREGIATLLSQTRAVDAGLLVAAAGFGGSGDLLDADLDHELNMVDVNCRAVLELSAAFGQRFADRGRGGLVLMSSLLAFQGVPRAANYAATKAYVQTLAEGLRRELAPHGVEVLAAAPGPVATGFAARADMTMDGAMRPDGVAAATLAALGRTGTTRPGWLSKALEWSMFGLPRWARTRILGAVMAGMTKHQLPAPSEATP
jgi:short-subunit dehydrogenase